MLAKIFSMNESICRLIRFYCHWLLCGENCCCSLLLDGVFFYWILFKSVYSNKITLLKLYNFVDPKFKKNDMFCLPPPLLVFLNLVFYFSFCLLLRCSDYSFSKFEFNSLLKISCFVMVFVGPNFKCSSCKKKNHAWLN